MNSKDSNDIDRMLQTVKKKPVPRHVAIIMDGNGRWAKRRGLPRVAGHRQGVEVVREIIETSCEIGVEYLTLYAFSTENWRRPISEIEALMSLLVEYLARETSKLHKNGVKIGVLGDITPFPERVRKAILKATDLTKNNRRLNVNIALNYGGRAEIIRAVKNMVQDAVDKKFSKEEIDEKLFEEYLYTRGIPDPDFLIRTSGECRISNFLLYQIAYTEFWFSDVLWPDFNKKIFLQAIIEYQNRQRRFGGIISEEG